MYRTNIHSLNIKAFTQSFRKQRYREFESSDQFLLENSSWSEWSVSLGVVCILVSVGGRVDEKIPPTSPLSVVRVVAQTGEDVRWVLVLKNWKIFHRRYLASYMCNTLYEMYFSVIGIVWIYIFYMFCISCPVEGKSCFLWFPVLLRVNLML